MKFYILLILFISLFNCPLSAQSILVSKDYPKNDFRPPLALAPSLAGCFGEVRGNHFHSGLDYRTNFRQGYPVYAIANGYVSRLKVQIGGFGNAVYITHPNGYTSVYAHLQKFNPKIARIVKACQYSQQSFNVDFPLLPIEVPVKKGEVIAWSGNTGSTAGPHLHFEIRDTQTEETINPQLFGINIPDHVKPVINGLYIYRFNGGPFDENTPRQHLRVKGYAGKYTISQPSVITVNGEAGFGIMTYDQQFPRANKNGVYSIKLLLDSQTVYASAMEGFYFQNSRAVNSYIDYPVFILTGRRVQKSFTDPGNPLTIYKTLVNRGIITLRDNKVHHMKYIIKDAKGNTSTLSFKIRNNQKASIQDKKSNTEIFSYTKDNTFSTEDFRISIPKGALYNDMEFRYKTTSPPRHAFSPVHHVHTRMIPLHGRYELWIKPDSTLPSYLYNKALIVSTRGTSQGGIYDKGYVKTPLLTFGNFYITVDTIAPIIRAVNVTDNKSFKKGSKMIFKVSDNLSGIQSFRGTIDGQWTLMEYDLKTATLWHTFDGTIPTGKHLFQLTVTDKKLNTKTYNATIYR